MAKQSQWSETAGSNSSAAPDGAPEGSMKVKEINNTIREMMASLAQTYKDQKGILVTAGTQPAYTVTTTTGHAAYTDMAVTLVRLHAEPTGDATINFDGLGFKTLVKSDGVQMASGEGVANALYAMAYDENADVVFALNADAASASGGSPGVCDGRLTLTSGTAVTVSDVTAAGTVYFTPYKGQTIGLYDGSAWSTITFAETSLSLTGLTANTNYDVFGYDNSGALALEALAWTDATTRATAITLQDGIYVKSGATTRRYLGTIRITGTTGQTEDSAAKRFVWNMYNRMSRRSFVSDTTDTWTYSTFTWRQANGSTSNEVAFIRGLDEDLVHGAVTGIVAPSDSTAYAVGVRVGLDSTTTGWSNGLFAGGLATRPHINSQIQLQSFFGGYPGLGYHRLVWQEIGGGAGTQTWRGDGGAGQDDQTGILGVVYA